jgi:hypothetical protein
MIPLLGDGASQSPPGGESMSKHSLTWVRPAIAYIAFFGWYTNLAGPLDDAEIARYLQFFEAADLSPERIATLRRFMEEDSGDDFYMLNALDLRAVPELVGEVEAGETSEDVMGRYMAHIYPELFRRACHPAIFGHAVAPALDLVGIEGAEDWTAAAMFRYRSRRDMLDIATNPDFRANHIYKVAALDKTIAYPIEPLINLGEPRFTVALILLVASLGARLISTCRPT